MGSSRDAVSKPHRIVVFDVGGYVQLETAVSVASDLTIAGQTAPGAGIGIMAREVSFSGSSNVIVRNLRFRQGDRDPDSKKSGINLLNTSQMIFDHVSIEFAQWNNIDSVGAKNVTIQYPIDADPIGQQFAAHTETGPYTGTTTCSPTRTIAVRSLKPTPSTSTRDLRLSGGLHGG